MEGDRKFHVSHMKFSVAYVLIAILIVSGIAGYFFTNSLVYYVPLIALGVAGTAIIEIKLRMNSISLGRESMIIQSGSFSKNSIRINYNYVSEIRVRQSFFQRLLGYGDIEIGIPGASLQQNFLGKGDVNIDTKGLHPGIVLKKFQSVKKIEQIILSRIPTRK